MNYTKDNSDEEEIRIFYILNKRSLSKVPDLEIDGETPLGHEDTVTRMSSQLSYAWLRAAMPFKLLNEVYTHSVLLRNKKKNRMVTQIVFTNQVIQYLTINSPSEAACYCNWEVE